MPEIDATYDCTVDAAYLFLSEPQNDSPLEQVEVAETPAGVVIVLDFDTAGHLVGMEILGAARCLPQDLLSTYRQIGGLDTAISE